MREAILLVAVLTSGCGNSPTESSAPTPTPTATTVTVATAHGLLRVGTGLDPQQVAAYADAAVDCAATRTTTRGAEVRTINFTRTPASLPPLTVTLSTDGRAYYTAATNTITATAPWNVMHEMQHATAAYLGVDERCRHCQDAKHVDCEAIYSLDCTVQERPICSNVGPGGTP